MFKYLKILLLAQLVIPIPGYSEDDPVEILSEGQEYFKEGDFEAALRKYNDIVFNYKGSKMYPLALYKKAASLYELQDIEYAINTYLEFFEKKYKDAEILDENYNKPFYGNYNYNSTIKLAEYYYNKEDFEKALYYYSYAYENHLYQTSCGSGGLWNHSHLMRLRAKCLEKLGRDSEAMQICLKYIIPMIFTNEQEIIELAIVITNKNYSKDDIQEELITAIDGVYSEPYHYDSSKHHYSLNLFGQKIRIGDYSKGFFVRIKSIERAKEIIKDSYFYKTYFASK